MIENRRLREVRKQITAFKTLLECADSISDSLMYQGKIEALQKEEKQILERYE